MTTMRIVETHETANWDDAETIARDVQEKEDRYLGWRVYFAAQTTDGRNIVGYRIADDEHAPSCIDVLTDDTISAYAAINNITPDADAGRIHDATMAEQMAYDEDHNRTEGLRMLAAPALAGVVAAVISGKGHPGQANRMKALRETFSGASAHDPVIALAGAVAVALHTYGKSGAGEAQRNLIAALDAYHSATRN